MIQSPFKTGIILSLTELVGDFGAKTNNALLAYGGYLLLATELLSFLRVGSLTMVNANWDGVSNLFTLLLGYLMGERFNRKQYLGLFLISFGLFLVN